MRGKLWLSAWYSNFYALEKNWTKLINLHEKHLLIAWIWYSCYRRLEDKKAMIIFLSSSDYMKWQRTLLSISCAFRLLSFFIISLTIHKGILISPSKRIFAWRKDTQWILNILKEKCLRKDILLKTFQTCKKWMIKWMLQYLSK